MTRFKISKLKETRKRFKHKVPITGMKGKAVLWKIKCVWQQKTTNWRNLKQKRVLMTQRRTPFEGFYIFSHFLPHVCSLTSQGLIQFSVAVYDDRTTKLVLVLLVSSNVIFDCRSTEKEQKQTKGCKKYLHLPRQTIIYREIISLLLLSITPTHFWSDNLFSNYSISLEA